ncbi:MAG: hypothetical protein LUO94_11645 [Methylococcaceae bacterium]|jgi:hypothetical protein|nr:hypothetical protein [Methylococcaceae bacterium]MDD1633522.1 hypothetical protein [Methylococcaceae bacterium]
MRKKVLITGSSHRADKGVAATVEFLILENIFYFTRQVISVNGGLC